MKYLFISILAFTLISCGESKSDVPKEANVDVSQSPENNSDLKDKLAALQPIPGQTFTDWIPETIGSMEQDRAGYYKNPGAVQGDYSGDGSLKYNIVDGAASPGAVTNFIKTLTNIEEGAVENYSIKKVNKKGLLALETTSGKYNAKLEFIYDDRFKVTLDGTNKSIEQLWALWDDYKLEELESL